MVGTRSGLKPVRLPSTPPLTPGWICPDAAAIPRKLPTATRFPTMLTGVHRRPPPSVTCADALWVALGERCRTAANETKTETRPSGRTWHASRSPRGGRRSRSSKNLRSPKSCTFTRFRVLRSPIHHRSRVYLGWAEGRSAFDGERLRTGVNETKTETTRWAAGGEVARIMGGAR